MKASNTSDYLIAGSVITCSLVLLVAMTVALSGYRFTGTGRELKIDFTTVAGIRPNSQVRYAGKVIGSVMQTRFLTLDERRKHPGAVVQVIAGLDSDAPTLYEGTSAQIVSDTILAEKFVDIIPTDISPDPKQQLKELAANEEISGLGQVGFDELSREGYQTIEKVNFFLSDLRREYPDLPYKVGSLIDHSETMVRNTDDLVNELDDLISKSDPTMRATLKDLRVVIENLKVTSTYTKAFSHTVGERPWRVIWGGDPTVLPTEKEILDSDKPLPVEKKKNSD